MGLKLIAEYESSRCMLKENIVRLNELAALLGHSNPKITLEHYASIIHAKSIDLGANFSLFSYNPATIEKKKFS